MDTQYTIQEELKELKSGLPLEKEEIYTVHTGYFENLAAAVLSKIKAGEANSPIEELELLSPLLSAIPRKTPFTVPEGYFTQNINSVADLVQEDNLPFELATANRKMPYEIPSGYFDKLPDQILAKVAKPQAKVISFNRAKWMRYMAAAVITGVIALTGTYFFKSNTSSVDLTKHPHEWIASKLKNVSTQDLEEFIKTTGTNINDQQIAKSSGSHTEAHKLLNDVSTSEISHFLSEVPAENDAATLN